MTAVKFFTIVHASIMSGLTIWLGGRMLSDRKPGLKEFCYCVLSFFVAGLARETIFYNSPLRTFATFGCCFLCVLLISDQRGINYIKVSVKLCLCIFAGDLILSLVFLFVWPELGTANMDSGRSDIIFLQNLVFLAIMCCLFVVIRIVKQHLNHSHKATFIIKPRSIWFRIMICILAIAVVGCFSHLWAKVYALSAIPELKTYMAMSAGVSALIVLVLLIIRSEGDVKKQSDYIADLELKMQLMNAQTEKQRYFHHNIINTLYGFEGALMEKNSEEAMQYYREITEQCFLINNENLLALQEIASLAMCTLLLRKLEDAQKNGIAIYIQIAPKFTAEKVLKQSDTIRIVGVLMDNALEAAIQADSPYIHLLFSSFDKQNEVVIRNTFKGELLDGCFTPIDSTKPGHEGVGLASCRELLKKHPKSLLNLSVEGQYVKTQLVI